MNNKFLKIAVIVPAGRIDYMTGTVVDGLIQLKDEGFLDFQVNASEHDWRNFSIKPYELPRADFAEYARASDYIFFINGKAGTDHRLARKIGRWDKTIFIDGSELGRNRRYDHEMQKKSLRSKRNKLGFVDARAYKKCALYFRREKPYLPEIQPLPFGIERKYRSRYNKEVVKDIDFNCIFGQDEYPLLRRYAQEILVDFCKKNKFTYAVKKTKTSEEFYDLLARSKVGISVGGGGFDTARFWEILGNNCLLLTESTDIYQIDSQRLKYGRIWEFGNLYDFAYQLERMGRYLREGYRPEYLDEEYERIIREHSSRARVEEILKIARNNLNYE